jgi:hypothetical protein
VSLSGQDFRLTGAVRYHCNQRIGGYCVNSEQNGGYCKDYKVRYLCCPKSPTLPVEKCYRWTKWLNRDRPSGFGDFELLQGFRTDTPPPVCADPIGIECRTVGTHISHTARGETYRCEVSLGGECRNANQSDARITRSDISAAPGPLLLLLWNCVISGPNGSTVTYLLALAIMRPFMISGNSLCLQCVLIRSLLSVAL